MKSTESTKSNSKLLEEAVDALGRNEVAGQLWMQVKRTALVDLATV
jgi:hypothetical protein